jgi:hypothetical protein
MQVQAPPLLPLLRSRLQAELLTLVLRGSRVPRVRPDPSRSQ